MLDFTLSLQPVIQFMTLPPPPGFEELVSTFANEVRNAFDRTATRVRAIVHSVQFQTSGNLSDYSPYSNRLLCPKQHRSWVPSKHGEIDARYPLRPARDWWPASPRACGESFRPASPG